MWKAGDPRVAPRSPRMKWKGKLWGRSPRAAGAARICEWWEQASTGGEVEERTWEVGSRSWTVRIVDGHAELPEGMPAVPACAFYNWDGEDEGCSSLVSVTIPLSVTVIGKFAFCRCPALEEVTIPPSMTTIERLAFGGCKALKAVTIPPSVTAIGDEAFYGCEALKMVTIQARSLRLPPIEACAFLRCRALEEVEILSTVCVTGDAFPSTTTVTQRTAEEMDKAAQVRVLAARRARAHTASPKPPGAASRSAREAHRTPPAAGRRPCGACHSPYVRRRVVREDGTSCRQAHARAAAKLTMTEGTCLRPTPTL